MKQQLRTPFLISLAMLAVSPVKGQDLQPPLAESPNRLSLSYRMAFNVSTSFKTGTSIPAPGIPGVNRNYDDGYNRVDNIGNAGGYTHYWGYENNSQYDPGSHTITMHSFSGSTVPNDSGEPKGCELTYDRELGRKGRYRWGLETAFNYMNVSIHDDRPAAVSGTLTSDTYQMPPIPGGGFVIPPPAAYHGAYDSTGIGNPAIYDSPGARATSPAVASGVRDFNADVFGWRVGPYVECSLATNLSFTLNGGFSLVGVFSDYHHFNETVSPGGGAAPISLQPGSGSHAGVLAGAHVGGGFLVTLGNGWGAFAGAQFQYAGKYTQREGASQACLDLSQSIFVSISATYSF